MSFKIKDFTKVTLTETIKRQEEALRKEIHYHIDRLTGYQAKSLLKIIFAFYEPEYALKIIYAELIRIKEKRKIKMAQRGKHYHCVLWNEITEKVEDDGVYTQDELDEMNARVEGQKQWYITEDWEYKYGKKYKG